MSTPTTNMAMGKGVDTDNARTYIETTLGAALDTLDGHDHSVTAKGLPPTRIAATTTIPASGKIVSPGAGDLFDLSPGSLTGLRLQGIASAVNYTQVANSATGNAVV